MDLFSQFTHAPASAPRSTPLARRPDADTPYVAPDGIRRAAAELPQPPFAPEEPRP
jgi:hypothetical protein